MATRYFHSGSADGQGGSDDLENLTHLLTFKNNRCRVVKSPIGAKGKGTKMPRTKKVVKDANGNAVETPKKEKKPRVNATPDQVYETINFVNGGSRIGELEKYADRIADFRLRLIREAAELLNKRIADVISVQEHESVGQVEKIKASIEKAEARKAALEAKLQELAG